MVWVEEGASSAERDERGRFRPGASGNPHGRPPGRPYSAVNNLADQAILAVLQHDLAAVRARKTEPRERREALGRLARLGARRVSSEQRVTVDEDSVEALIEVIRSHISDPDVLLAICSDLELGP
jgi:hypothetical protein